MHVITGLGLGGAEMMLWKVLSASRGEWSSVVVCLGPDGPMAGKIRSLGIGLHCLGLRGLTSGALGIFRLAKLVRDFRPHVIQGWMPHANLATSVASLLALSHAPVVWNIRMSLQKIEKEKLATRVLIRFGAGVSRYPAAIVYNSSSGAKDHERIGYRPRKRVLIPNGFNCDVFRPDESARQEIRAALSLPSRTLLVGLISRYHPVKDHAGFLASASLVAARHSNTHFLLVGPGVTQSQASLVQQIAERKLEGCVHLLGERADIPRVTAALDIACSSSAWSEGFSNSIGEAMACGVPCVVTDVGDSGVLVGATGRVVPPSDPRALADAIIDLLDAPSEKRQELGCAARRRIEADFSLSKIAQRYQRLYYERSESYRRELLTSRRA